MLTHILNDRICTIFDYVDYTITQIILIRCSHYHSTGKKNISHKIDINYYLSPEHNYLKQCAYEIIFSCSRKYSLLFQNLE